MDFIEDGEVSSPASWGWWYLAWQPVFWNLWVRDSTIQNQVVIVASVYTCAHLCWVSSCPGLAVWLLLGQGTGQSPDCAVLGGGDLSV